MRILLAECVTSGGLFSHPQETPETLPPALRREAVAMVEAVASDLAATGARLCVLRHPGFAHVRLPPAAGIVAPRDATEERSRLAEEAAAADFTLLVAPETDGQLLDRVRLVTAAGGRLLGPGEPFVELAADKHRTAEILAAAGVRTPWGIALHAGETPPREMMYPAVVKPRGSCGSDGVRFVASAAELPPAAEPRRLERFCPGQAASAVFFAGPRGAKLIACFAQTLSDDGRFEYQGGAYPLPEGRAVAARPLLEAAAAALPPACGYFGIDFVLGAGGPADDVVIEVNPRLTTSYVGLREAFAGNPAECLLRWAQGEACAAPLRDVRFRFTAEGKITAD